LLYVCNMKTASLLLSIGFYLTFAAPLFGQTENPGLKIQHLTGDFYVYTTYQSYGGKPFPSNSMYVITQAGAVMIDTPWDSTQFQPLLDSIEIRHGKQVVLCLATHSHEDRTGGFDFLKAKGIQTYSSRQTLEICKANNQKQAQHTFQKDTLFTVGQYRFEAYYPGEGHTPDNLVVWFEKDRVLYGGCLIKSTEATDLGNIREANLLAWPQTIRNLKKRFPQARYIIPGHQDWSSTQSLDHTLRLLQQHANQRR